MDNAEVLKGAIVDLLSRCSNKQLRVVWHFLHNFIA